VHLWIAILEAQGKYAAAEAPEKKIEDLRQTGKFVEAQTAARTVLARLRSEAVP
jgi:hypothetical protein